MKKKLGAFGSMARYNPLKRPKDDTVLLVRNELRYEPFWHITARRLLDYSCQVTYTVPVPVHNPTPNECSAGPVLRRGPAA